MNRAALACMLALVAPVAMAQHEGHDMPPVQEQAPPPSPALPPPTAEEIAHAFPDLGGMDMRGHMDDDPLVATLAFDRLETIRADGVGAFAWELHGWAGHRRDRFAWRSRGERASGGLREGELELLWWHATGPWWNRVLGLRHDFAAGERRDWLALGVEGIAPYRIDVAATLYAGKDGIGARVEGSHDLLLTQRLVLQPRLEAEGYAGGGAPHGSIEAGLRLRYELNRQFAPYVGYAWSSGGAEDGETGGRWVAGLRTWF
jgi:copper resistance protein B